MSDNESGPEDEVDESLSNSEVNVKYRTAGQIANSTFGVLVREMINTVCRCCCEGHCRVCGGQEHFGTV